MAAGQTMLMLGVLIPSIPGKAAITEAAIAVVAVSDVAKAQATVQDTPVARATVSDRLENA